MTNGNRGAAPRDQSIAESISVSPPFLLGWAQTLRPPLYASRNMDWFRKEHFINIGFCEDEVRNWLRDQTSYFVRLIVLTLLSPFLFFCLLQLVESWFSSSDDTWRPVLPDFLQLCFQCRHNRIEMINVYVIFFLLIYPHYSSFFGRMN